MSDPRRQFGDEGERIAEAFLRKLGLTLVARSFRTPVGEIDLVMQAGATVVFVEVKTRADRRLADPQDAVGAGKRAKLAKAAEWFLHQKRWENRPARFDVVAIVMREGLPPEIEHFPDAFS